MKQPHDTGGPADKQPRRDFVLRLRALPRPADATDPDAIRRLRAALKQLGRTFGFSVIECRPVDEGRHDG